VQWIRCLSAEPKNLRISIRKRTHPQRAHHWSGLAVSLVEA